MLAPLLAASPVNATEVELRLKAEFIERFTRFIYWPEEAASPAVETPFTLCAHGKHPLVPYLRAIGKDYRIKRREVVFRLVRDIGEAAGCHVLFIPGSAAPEIEQILDGIRGLPILSVGDTPGFAVRGVAVNFFLERDLVRFEINSTAAARAGLEISSRLLQLARRVEEE